MKSCLNPATLNGQLGLTDFVRVASQAGFKGIELRYPQWVEHACAHGVAGLRRLLEEHGLEPACFGYPASLTRPQSWASDLEKAAEAADLACELGLAGGMTVLPFRCDGVQVADPAEQADKLGRLADVAAGRGLSVYLEFIGLHPPAEQRGEFAQTATAALALAERTGRPNLGLVVDAYHWYLRGGALSEIEAIPRGRPIFCHIDDAPSGECETLTDPMRVLPGEGVIDLGGFLRALRGRGWDGFVSVELFSEQLRQMEPLEAARRARRSLDHLGVE
jgi:sugar phosphate isomerase/epimerase